MLTVVLVGIITRILIGYNAYANPIARHHGPSMEAATVTMVEYGESAFHSFKLKRKIAMETLTHFTWHLDTPAPPVSLAVVRSIELPDPLFYSQSSPPRLRPPAQA